MLIGRSNTNLLGVSAHRDLPPSRIAFVAEYFPPEPYPIGGAGVIMQAIAAAIDQRGAQAIIIVDGFTENHCAKRGWSRNGIRVHSVPIVRNYPKHVTPAGRTHRRHFLSRLRVNDIYRQLRPDVLHLHIHPNGILRFGYEMKRRFHIPVVVTTHGLDWVVYHHHSYEDVPFGPCWKESVESVDLWIPCGPKDDHGLRQWGIPSQKIVAAYNGVDVPGTLPSTLTRRAAQPYEILCVGRMLEKKGVLDLAEAFVKLCQNWTGSNSLALRLVGALDAEIKKKLESILERCRPLHNFYLEHECSQEEVMTMLCQADVFCYPTKCMEGQPLAPLEAAAQGCPMAISDIPSHRAIFERDIHAVYFTAGNVGSLAESLLRLLVDISLRRTIRQNAFELVRVSFNRQDMLMKYMEIYRNLLSGLVGSRRV